MIVTLRIPDADVEQGTWLPTGVSRVRIRHQGATGDGDGEMHIYVRDEWIIKEEQ